MTTGPSLSLAAIVNFNFYSRNKTLKAIGPLIPNLREVHYGGTHVTKTDNMLSPDQLRSLLSSSDPSSCWSNVYITII